MKKNILINLFSLVFFCFPITRGKCQAIEDSMMIAKSEKWNVVYKKGIFMLSQPGVNETFSMNLIKLDSGKVKQKVKDSADIEYSDEGGLDLRKYMTITKSRVYQLQTGTDENSTKALFAVTNESKLKRQTVLGKIIGKKDAGYDEPLSSVSTIFGTIKRNNDPTVWNFSITGLTKIDIPNGAFPSSFLPLPEGSLTSEKDSLFFVRPTFKGDVVLVDAQGEHLAAVKYSKKPLIIWVRKDIDNSLQDAIGVLFGVMISAGAQRSWSVINNEKRSN